MSKKVLFLILGLFLVSACTNSEVEVEQMQFCSDEDSKIYIYNQTILVNQEETSFMYNGSHFMYEIAEEWRLVEPSEEEINDTLENIKDLDSIMDCEFVDLNTSYFESPQKIISS